MLTPFRVAFLVCLLCATTSIAQNQSVKTLQHSADSLLSARDYAGALQPLNQILTTDPQNKNALGNRAYVYSELKNYALAVKDAKALLETDPYKASYWNDVGWFLLLNGDLKEAKKYCERSIELDHNLYSSYMNMGHIYAMQKNKRKYSYYYTRAAEYIPNEQKLKDGPLSDFAIMATMKRFPYDTGSFIRMFNRAYNTLTRPNATASAVLDTIFNYLNYGLSQNDPRIFELKKRFLAEEEKYKTWRYHVMSDFLWDLGIEEVRKRNYIKGGQDYLLVALGYSNKVEDTLAAIHQYLEFGRLYVDQANIGLDIMKVAIRYALPFGDTPLLAHVYFDIAEVSHQKKEHDSAVFYGRAAYRLATNTNDSGLLFATAGNLSSFYGVVHKNDSMKYYFTVAMKYAAGTSIGKRQRSTAEFNHCSDLYNLHLYKECIDYSLKIYQQYQADTSAELAELSETIGSCYYKLNNSKAAAPYFRKALNDYRLYQKTFPGDHAASISSERGVCFKYLKMICCIEKNTTDLFDLGELSKSNDLLAKLSDPRVPVSPRSLAAEQQDLKEDEAALFFSNSGSVGYGYGIGLDRTKNILMTETAQRVDAFYTPPAMKQFKTAVMTENKKTIGRINSENAGADEDAERMFLLFSTMYQLYKNVSSDGGNVRGLNIHNSSMPAMDIANIGMINDLLYNYYVLPFEPILRNKKTIYIATEGLTAIFPFEALKNSQGQYLGELYNIIYVPSFTSRRLLQQKAPNASGSMLALGDPVYKDYKPDQMNGRANDLGRAGFSDWANLPGTGEELAILKQTVPDVTVVQKETVSESYIKQMDNNGDLSGYNYLHFAVHGMTSWDNYDDNSLILTEPLNTGEDGFLQFPEIAGLSINTRLVCLSACETGIGLPKDNTDYSLITAFLIAGSKGVISSSWKIDDKATGVFMAEFYRNVFSEKKEIPEALYLTKQKFIRGDFGEKYKKPFYWAAFKYTGI